LTFVDNDKIQILWRNAKQILNVVAATFPSFESEGPSSNCNELGGDVEPLACKWKTISQTLPSPGDESKSTEEWFSNTSKVVILMTGY
jgi:ethanolaminephosphotransferase